MKILPVTDEDIPLLMNLKRQALTGCAKDYTADELANWDEYLRRLDPLAHFEGICGFVARTEQQPAGFISYILTGENAQLTNLFILPPYTGQGYGEKLLLRMEHACAALGVRNIAVRATLNSVGFYEAHGYIYQKQGISRAGFAIGLLTKTLSG